MKRIAKSKQHNPFTGRWRIVSLSASDQGFVDEEEDGYIEFGVNDQGKFYFGWVHGEIDCRRTMTDGEPVVNLT